MSVYQFRFKDMVFRVRNSRCRRSQTFKLLLL